MDTLSIGTAILFIWRHEFSRPTSLDEDLRALYEYKRSLQPAPAAPLGRAIGTEIAEGITHWREALRLAFRSLATH